jgi:hypothetical protein
MNSDQNLQDVEATDDELKGVCYFGMSIIVGIAFIIAAVVFLLV